MLTLIANDNYQIDEICEIHPHLHHADAKIPSHIMRYALNIECISNKVADVLVSSVSPIQ